MTLTIALFYLTFTHQNGYPNYDTYHCIILPYVYTSERNGGGLVVVAEGGSAIVEGLVAIDLATQYLTAIVLTLAAEALVLGILEAGKLATEKSGCTLNAHPLFGVF